MVDNEDNSLTRDISIVKAVLESGHSVELPAKGFSMFPALRPGDSITVKSLTEGKYPLPGDVVVFSSQKSLVMHRLISVSGNPANPLFLTQGDSLSKPDKPWSADQLAGIAVLFKRKGKEFKIEPSVPGLWRRRYNRILLWLYIRQLKVIGIR